MYKHNNIKAIQLGMSYGKANAKLRKLIIFDLIKKLNLNVCYRCHNSIENIDTLSIEHKIPWFNSSNPYELFFDINNITFSHLLCNIKHKRNNSKLMSHTMKLKWSRTLPPEGMAWCGYCKQTLLKEFFSFNKSTRTKTEWICKKCRKEVRNKK
jgi:hypothetical protein